MAESLGVGSEYRSVRDRLVRLRVNTGNRLSDVESYPERRERIDNDHLHLLLKLHLPVDANCIDVGAHEGAFLADMVAAAPEGWHIAYEPLPEFAALLRQRFPGVDVREAALSCTNGNATFSRVRNIPSMSGLRRARTDFYPTSPEFENISVQTERLDDHLPAEFVPTLIKVDVEGAQMLVFEGARRTITTYRPTVVFEHGLLSAYDYGFSSDDVFSFLVRDSRLRIFDLDGNGPYSSNAFAGERHHWQWVARR